MSENHVDLNATFQMTMTVEFIFSDQFPHELNYEFISQTCFAAHASSHLFTGRNMDCSQEWRKLSLGAW